MSPRDATPQNSGYSQLSFGSSLTRKSSLRGSISKERLVRGSSPLTPWEDNSSKKRKPSLKGSTRQTKIKLTVKDNKKKNKKDETKSRNNDSKSKCGVNPFHKFYLMIRIILFKLHGYVKIIKLGKN